MRFLFYALMCMITILSYREGVCVPTLVESETVHFTLNWVDNVAPVVSNISVEGYSGNIEITYDLSDCDGDLCSVFVQYKGSGAGDVWTTLTPGDNDTLTGIAPATDLTLTWQSVLDLPNANGEIYSIRIYANDGTIDGAESQYSPVNVINTYVFSQLSYYKVYEPQINNSGYVTWSGDFIDENDSHVSRDIYLYNGSDTPVQITNFDCFAYTPQISDSGYIVWAGVSSSAGTDTEIYYYDGSAITQLTSNDHNDGAPQINGNGDIVWAGSDGNDTEIFLYNGSTVTQITNNSYDDHNPQINDDGDIVWAGWDGTDWDIYLYDGSTTSITSNSVDDVDPQINNAGTIVWAGGNGTSSEIYIYKDSTTTAITSNSYEDIEPQINSDGNITWAGKNGADYEIFSYTATPTPTVLQITTNSYEDISPKINDIGEITWFGGTGSGTEIYVYNGTTTTQLTYDAYQDINNQLNDSRHIVWTRWNNTYWEIMLAVPSGSESIDIIALEKISNLVNLVWYINPPNTKYKLLWNNDLTETSWNEVDGSALTDIVNHPDGTKSWTDYGNDPDMGGESSADVQKRFYKLETK